MGFPITHGSTIMVLPAGVSMRKLEWPSHVSLMPFRFMVGGFLLLHKALGNLHLAGSNGRALLIANC